MGLPTNELEELTRHDSTGGELSPPVWLANGEAVLQGVFARPGVQIYVNPDGSARREYRSPAVLRSAVERGLYNLRPATIGHPGLLTAATAAQHIVGTSGQDISIDAAGNVRGSVALHTARGVKAAKDRTHGQISPGYKIKIRKVAGVSPEGERYDWEQTEITEVNHIGMVTQARGGAIASFRLDSKGAALAAEGYTRMDPNELLTEARVKVAILEGDAKTAAITLQQAVTRADAAEAKIITVTKEHETLKARYDALETAQRADAAEAERQIGERIALEIQASAILPANVLPAVRLDSAGAPSHRFAGHKARDIKAAVIKHLCKIDIRTDATDDYVQARYDAAVETFAAGKRSFAPVTTNIAAGSVPANKLATAAQEVSKASAEASNVFIAPKA